MEEAGIRSSAMDLLNPRYALDTWTLRERLGTWKWSEVAAGVTAGAVTVHRGADAQAPGRDPLS